MLFPPHLPAFPGIRSNPETLTRTLGVQIMRVNRLVIETRDGRVLQIVEYPVNSYSMARLSRAWKRLYPSAIIRKARAVAPLPSV